MIPKLLCFCMITKVQVYEQNNTEKDRLAFSSSQSKTASMFS